MATRIEEAGSPGPTRRRPLWPLHVLTAVVVVAGIAAVALRPLAPDLGGVPDPARWFDADHLAAVEAYHGPRYLLRLLGLALRIAIPCLIAFTPTGRRVVAGLVDRMGGSTRPVLAGAAVVAAIVVIVDLAVLPLNVWLGWYHDGMWGFSTQSLPEWLWHWTRNMAAIWLIVAAGAAGALGLARRAPRAFAPLAGLAGGAAAALLVLAAPLVLEPLQHRTVPLPEGEMRTDVSRVIEAAGEDMDEILVAEASARTTRQNAYVSGLGATRRIVLYDTLLEARPPEDVGMVVAHELAHHRNGDLARGTAAAAAGVVAAAYVLAGVMGRRVRAGKQRTLADPRGAAVAVAVVVLLVNGSAPVAMNVSRDMEAAADLGSLELTGDRDVYLRQKAEIGRANLSDPAPPTWARLLWSSHPPAASRLEMGERWPLDWRGPVRPHLRVGGLDEEQQDR
ncbi:hypothetical protein ER308_00585 [Egibacter rhizosphaerae]|uniref:Peptidase M48 domain-containing protein n=1 Tax=Egibacter rhizosphaerae TaxID=1670831 RepID=A0A411YAI6_9ACTN|nr:M48 family metalloprotease [Egibacter rhizosphaerae]QBI18216.1 hypothetical protein ER308_00585 [Egibacter rhizosphaerae]